MPSCLPQGLSRNTPPQNGHHRPRVASALRGSDPLAEIVDDLVQERDPLDLALATAVMEVDDLNEDDVASLVSGFSRRESGVGRTHCGAERLDERAVAGFRRRRQRDIDRTTAEWP
jgi:hypothetical protein